MSRGGEFEHQDLPARVPSHMIQRLSEIFEIPITEFHKPRTDRSLH